MAHKDRTDVLVVGAGPVGMWTALLLSKSGVQVKIIDQAEGPASESYACVIHRQTLELFDQCGLADNVLALGHHVHSVAFYEREHRRAEVRLSEVAPESTSAATLVTLPQSALEELLARKLRKEKNVTLLWHHRLSNLQDNKEQEVLATIDKLEETAKGYMVPEWETVVQKSLHTQAGFVVGADGHNSHVRQCLGIGCEKFGAGPDTFAAFEFAVDFSPRDEARIVLDDFGTGVLWPLPENRWRWIFQLGRGDQRHELPLKDRSHLHFEEPASEGDSLHYLRKLLAVRAPWFACDVKEVDWSCEMEFERRLARPLGSGGCRLVGDAAHQTGPIASQSMNVGLREAVELVHALKGKLHEGSRLNLSEGLDSVWRDRWSALFGLAPAGLANQLSPGWVQEHLARLLPCIPASDGDLLRFLKMMRVP